MADASWQLFSAEPHYSMQVGIEGVVYSFQLRWNSDARDRSWHLRILDETESTVLAGWRRLLGFGPWLTTSDVEPLGADDVRALYDLGSGLFPGVLLALMSRPPEGEMADADHTSLVYLDPVSFAETFA